MRAGIVSAEHKAGGGEPHPHDADAGAAQPEPGAAHLHPGEPGPLPRGGASLYVSRTELWVIVLRVLKHSVLVTCEAAMAL